MYGNDPVRVPLPGRHVERGLVIQGGMTGGEKRVVQAQERGVCELRLSMRTRGEKARWELLVSMNVSVNRRARDALLRLGMDVEY